MYSKKLAIPSDNRGRKLSDLPLLRIMKLFAKTGRVKFAIGYLQKAFMSFWRLQYYMTNAAWKR